MKVRQDSVLPTDQTAGSGSDTAVVRPAEASDAAAIRQVHERAFGGRPNEADVVASLTKAGRVTISLVAILDGKIVGHVLFSPVTLEPDELDFRGLGLAPLAILPKYQRRGIGSLLVTEGLDTCRAADYCAVVVLGDPRYYPRFGFRQASDYGLGNEYGASEAFMALELVEGGLLGCSGVVRYAPEFGETDC